MMSFLSLVQLVENDIQGQPKIVLISDDNYKELIKPTDVF